MLNKDAYTLIAGNPTKWDQEIIDNCSPGKYPGTYNSADLIMIQVKQHQQGRRSAYLSDSIFGFYVRDASGLTATQILAATKERGGNLDGTIESAISWGINWANQDPNNREFFARTKDVHKES